MSPIRIEAPNFGSIKVDSKKYDYDIVVFFEKVEKRKKWITKEKHGTSHKFTREEMEEYLDKVDANNLEVIIIGTGQYGKLYLLEETENLLHKYGIETRNAETPKAARIFQNINKPREQKLGIFHVTC